MGFRSSRRFLEIVAEDGFTVALRTAQRFLSARLVQRTFTMAHFARIQRTAYELRGHPGIGDPLRVYTVSPEDIEHGMTVSRFGRPVQLFAIEDGDWDLREKPLDEYSTYSMFVEHFQNETPWEDTATFREHTRRLKSGDTLGGLDIPGEEQTVEAYRDYLEYVDELYSRLKNEGYKRQQELNPEDDFLNRDRHPALNEIQIYVGRDGTMMCKEGYHRLFISKILGLKRIPVRTEVRHLQWQHLRDEIARSDSLDDLSKSARQHVDHPELKDVTATSTEN